MFLLKILRLFTGYVRFRAVGGFGERFINLCTQNGITLWDIEVTGNEIFASTSPEDYRKIRIPASGSGMKANAVRKAGLPFFIFRHRKRIGIPAGLIIFIIFTAFLSTRIWLIDVEGCNNIPEESIILAAENAGLRVGCSKLALNPVVISLEAGEKVDGVSEFSVNISGSRATIKVKEREAVPDIQNSDGMFDIVASADAQLVVLEPYRGTALAKVMNTVMKNEIIISGIVANKDESTGYVHADGYAVGRTEKIIHSTVSENEKFRGIINSGKRYSLFLLGREIPLWSHKNEYKYMIKKEKLLSFSGKKMPFGIFCTEYSSLSGSESKLSEKQKELICTERFMQQAKDYTCSRQTINENIKTEFGAEDKSISGKFTCYENIGIEREFSIEEGSPPE